MRRVSLSDLRWPLYAIGLCALSTSGAFAQQATGARVGDVKIGASAKAGIGADSNIFYANENDSANDGAIISGTFANLQFGLGVANRKPNKVALGLDVDTRLRFFTTEAEGAEISASADGVNDFSGHAHAAFLPKSSVTTEVHAKSTFSRRPAGASSTDGYDRLDVNGGVDLRFRPGSGPSRPFEFKLGVRAGQQQFLDPPDVSARRSEKKYYTTDLQSRWRFLPKTAIVAQVTYRVNDFEENSLDGTPISALVGLQGLVTNRISVDLRAGYHNTLADSGESFSGAVGRAQVEYRIEPTLSVKLGAARSVTDSSFSNFVTTNRLFGETQLHIGRHVTVSAGLAYDDRVFSELIAGANQRPSHDVRVDPVLRSKAGVGYRIGDIFSVSVDFEREDNSSDFVMFVDLPQSNGGIAEDHIAFSRQVVMLNLGAKY